MQWREQQVETTRSRIVETFVELARDGEPVTMAAVARSSGISPATVYRHFPNRDALVAAAAMAHVTDGVDEASSAWTLDDMAAHLRALWSDLAENLAVTREGAVSESGREMRAVRFALLRGHFESGVAQQGIDPTDGAGRQLIAALSLLLSVHAFLDLHDRQGMSVDDAVGTVDWACSALLRSLGIEPAAFVISDQRPTRERSEP